MLTKVNGFNPKSNTRQSANKQTFTGMFLKNGEVWGELVDTKNTGKFVSEICEQATSKVGLSITKSLKELIPDQYYRTPGALKMVLTDEEFVGYKLLKTFKEKKVYLSKFLSGISIKLDNSSRIIEFEDVARFIKD